MNRKPSSSWAGVLGLILTLPLSSVLLGQEFLDVVVQDRFFRSPETHPVLTVRTREPRRVDLVIYEAGGRAVGFREGSSLSNQHRILLQGLPPTDRGLYLFQLFARSEDGRRLAEYPERPEGGEYIEVSDCRWVPERQRIEYLLPKAACLRIRAGLADSAYIDEVLPWEAQPAGRHVIPWAKATNSPVVMELIRRPDFQVRVLALSLPVNLISDQRLRSERYAGNTTPDATLPPSYADRSALPGGGLYSSVRKRSQISIADDYSLTLTATPAPGNSVVNLRLDCAESDRVRLLNQRFEVMIFMDGLFLTEDELAILPFNYRMSTRGLSPGQHLVTMNVLDSKGVPGTASTFVQVVSNPSNNR